MSAFVQCQTVQSGGVGSLSKSITTTAGNSIVVFVVNTAPTAGFTITQTSGDATTATAAENDDSGQAWYVTCRVARNVAGGATTFTFTISDVNAMMFLVETTPLNATSLDVFAIEASSAATTHAVGPTSAIADATELALAVWEAGGSTASTPSVNNSFTIPTNGNVMGAGVTDCRACLAYLDCTSAPSVTLTTTASVTALGLLATFRLAGGGGPTTDQLAGIWAESTNSSIIIGRVDA
jgi:hypothetical protein